MLCDIIVTPKQTLIYKRSSNILNVIIAYLISFSRILMVFDLKIKTEGQGLDASMMKNIVYGTERNMIGDSCDVAH